MEVAGATFFFDFESEDAAPDVPLETAFPASEPDEDAPPTIGCEPGMSRPLLSAPPYQGELEEEGPPVHTSRHLFSAMLEPPLGLLDPLPPQPPMIPGSSALSFSILSTNETNTNCQVRCKGIDD